MSVVNLLRQALIFLRDPIPTFLHFETELGLLVAWPSLFIRYHFLDRLLREALGAERGRKLLSEKLRCPIRLSGASAEHFVKSCARINQWRSFELDFASER